MKKFLSVVAIYLQIVGISIAESQASECEIAVDACNAFVNKNANARCVQDSDCEVHYYGCAAGCVVRPYVIAKPGLGKDELLELGRLVAKVKQVCPKGGPACSPIPAIPRCVKGSCLDGK